MSNKSIPRFDCLNFASTRKAILSDCFCMKFVKELLRSLDKPPYGKSWLRPCRPLPRDTGNAVWLNGRQEKYDTPRCSSNAFVRDWRCLGARGEGILYWQKTSTIYTGWGSCWLFDAMRRQAGGRIKRTRTCHAALCYCCWALFGGMMAVSCAELVENCSSCWKVTYAGDCKVLISSGNGLTEWLVGADLPLGWDAGSTGHGWLSLDLLLCLPSRQLDTSAGLRMKLV